MEHTDRSQLGEDGEAGLGVEEGGGVGEGEGGGGIRLVNVKPADYSSLLNSVVTF